MLFYRFENTEAYIGQKSFPEYLSVKWSQHNCFIQSVSLIVMNMAITMILIEWSTSHTKLPDA